MNALFGCNEAFYNPIEVADNPDDLNRKQAIVFKKAGSNPETYKFRSIQAAFYFSKRFSNNLSFTITIVGTIQFEGYFNISTVQFELRGKHDDGPLEQKRTHESDINGNLLIIANTYPTYLKYFNLERYEKSDDKIVAQVSWIQNDQTTGGIFVDSCVFTDRNTIAKDNSEISFIKVVKRSASIIISNNAFNAGKFGSG
ncbi:MAG: hypothetical protein EZS28_015252 [Streblomastix strix]|uniref:Uncharacterized protein n=1 Tax=Streblomastix strix TaxID=222440 RepID=A0A5J4W3D6_9EUKA|nr:MAG: hypothetical protein EZS28_015252 [Streblomastix strix]